MNYALKTGAGVPPTTSLFSIHYSLRESFFHANRPLTADLNKKGFASQSLI